MHAHSSIAWCALQESSLAKREEVRAILGLSSEEAHELGAASDSEDGQSGKKVEHEDAAFF